MENNKIIKMDTTDKEDTDEIAAKLKRLNIEILNQLNQSHQI